LLGQLGQYPKARYRQWRYELFYWDYVIGILVFSLVAAFTLGSHGSSGRHFTDDLAQASWSNIGSAFVGGIIFNLANILLTAAIAIAGMSVAFPIGIGIALVLGVVINYLGLQKGDPALLFGGVLLVAAAIILNAVAYKKIGRQCFQSKYKGHLPVYYRRHIDVFLLSLYCRGNGSQTILSNPRH